MKRILIISMITILMVGFQALAAMDFSVGAKAGLTIPMTDINEDENNMNFFGGLTGEAWIKDYLSLGISPFYTKLSGAEGLADYESTLMGADLLLKYRPVSPKLSLNFESGRVKRIAPFVMGGIGLASYDTEGTVLATDGIALTAPTLGLGVSMLSRCNMNLDLGVQWTHALTDEFDNVKDSGNDAYLTPFLGFGYTFGKKVEPVKIVEIVEEETAPTAPARTNVRNRATASGTTMAAVPVVRDRVSMTENFILTGVQFEINSSRLTADAKTVLDEVVTALKRNPRVRLEVGGHTDNTGSLDLNNRLSLQRANSVRDYLISQGIAEDRLEAKGYGPSMPIADNSTAAGRAENRRIEFVILPTE